jgi:regulator of sirC expression with transglutaminase-like and TPR domain
MSVQTDSENRAGSARERFALIAAGPEAEIDLAEAALWLAAESCEGLDVARCMARLDALADALRGAVSGGSSLGERVAALNRELFEVHGFRGARDDYYDPRNSFLNEVLERRRGIPITLCVLYMEIARRVGLRVEGVSFPGHFLAKAVADPAAEGASGGPEEILIDAFEGRVVSIEECRERLHVVLGAQVALTPELLRAASKKQILLRMLSNLKSIYTALEHYEAALACCDRSLLLVPDSPLEHRDRGLIYKSLECVRPALTELERFLELSPNGEGSGAIRRLVAVLRQRLPRVH